MTAMIVVSKVCARTLLREPGQAGGHPVWGAAGSHTRDIVIPRGRRTGKYSARGPQGRVDPPGPLRPAGGLRRHRTAPGRRRFYGANVLDGPAAGEIRLPRRTIHLTAMPPGRRPKSGGRDEPHRHGGTRDPGLPPRPPPASAGSGLSTARGATYNYGLRLQIPSFQGARIYP